MLSGSFMKAAQSRHDVDIGDVAVLCCREGLNGGPVGFKGFADGHAVFGSGDPALVRQPFDLT